MSSLTTNKLNVKNAFDFAEEVVNYNHNLYMASLDVESSFTNIPVEETIKNCVNNLFSNKKTSETADRSSGHLSLTDRTFKSCLDYPCENCLPTADRPDKTNTSRK